jgi:hypothetical protein
MPFAEYKCLWSRRDYNLRCPSPSDVTILTRLQPQICIPNKLASSTSTIKYSKKLIPEMFVYCLNTHFALVNPLHYNS